MFNLPDIFYDVNIVSVTIRLVLAVIIGGIIGLERGANNHAAGFRTHILVCVGAALVMVTNEYICQFNDLADPARLGAQVITGVGFLGAGTIIVTSRQKVQGLTTAAGLWASACMGLAIGAGFYECVVLVFVIILLVFRTLPFVENMLMEKARNMNIYVEFNSILDVSPLIGRIKSCDVHIYEVEIQRDGVEKGGHPSAVFTIRLNKSMSHAQVLAIISDSPNIYTVEEI